MQYSVIARTKLFIWILLTAGFCRLLSLGLYPLSDKTESRYGEIARIMAETGNWVTPHVDYGVPFWGKPPLSTWVSALGIKLFGENDFAVRIPSLFFAVGVVFLVFYFARQLKGKSLALSAAVVLTVSPMFFVSGGAVMTDPALVFGTTLSMVGFYLALFTGESSRKVWGYLFFVGLAIGLLAKGPVAVVLTGVPIFLWMVWQRKWLQVWQQLPWFSGVLLAAILVLPWYLLAENRTPGFIDYFIVGEHWKRFVEPGWSGDLYGGAHSRQRGTIWAFWILTAFPWSLLILSAFFQKHGRKLLAEGMRGDRDWSRYLLLWTITPMLFFSMAGNILWTYILPGLPAFSLLIATFWCSDESVNSRVISKVATVVSGLFVVCVFVLFLGLIPFNKSQHLLVTAYKETATDGARLTYLFSRPYSAQFYSGGKALLLEKVVGDEPIFQNQQIDYVAVRPAFVSGLPESISLRLEKLGEYQDGYNLYVEIPLEK